MNIFPKVKAVVSDIIAAMKYVWNGRELDPKRFARTPPKWWKGAPKSDMPEGEFFEARKGGFAVGFDGQLIYSNNRTAAETKADATFEKYGLTEAEKNEMLAYNPPLTNTELAGQIKGYWKEGRRYKDIAILCNVSLSMVKHYCACFERARRANNAHEI